LKPPRLSLALIIVVALVGGVIGGLLFLSPSEIAPESGGPPMQTVGCVPAEGPCEIVVDALAVTLVLGPPVRPLQPMPVVLQVSGGDIKEPRIAFTMMGMDMGRNRYGLDPAGPDRWEVEAILPVCTVGRRDWLASVEYIANGQQRAVAFSFPSDR